MASSNRSRTREAPTPTNISTKSEPEMEKKGTPASPATAFASRVLPVPGGPTKRTPLGILAPTLTYFWGSFRKSTISSSSSFSSSSPATSLKVTFLSASVDILARLFPKFIIFALLPPDIWRFITFMITSTITTIRIRGRTDDINTLSPGTSATLMAASLSSSSISWISFTSRE